MRPCCNCVILLTQQMLELVETVDACTPSRPAAAAHRSSWRWVRYNYLRDYSCLRILFRCFKKAWPPPGAVLRQQDVSATVAHWSGYCVRSPNSSKYSGANTLPNDAELSSSIVLILPYALPFTLRMLVTIHGVGQYNGDGRPMSFVGRTRTAAR